MHPSPALEQCRNKRLSNGSGFAAPKNRGDCWKSTKVSLPEFAIRPIAISPGVPCPLLRGLRAEYRRRAKSTWIFDALLKSHAEDPLRSQQMPDISGNLNTNGLQL